MSFRVFLHCGLAVLLGTLIQPASLMAEEIEDTIQLQEAARNALVNYLQPDENNSQLETEVKMLPLDSRLRLARCGSPLDYQITVPPTRMGLATIKIVCNGLARWSLFAPAQITLYGKTAVATHSLERGNVLQAGDFQFVRQNLNLVGANYVDPAALVIGQELKRPLREGEPLRLSYLSAPKVVQRGDRVTLEAQANGLTVAAPGTAMANGQVGERIRVKNSQSDKVVDALVIAPGRVRVKYE